MHRVLQTHRLGPHRLEVVQFPDDEGGGLVAVVVDGAVITEPPLDVVPTTDELMHLYATWKDAQGTGGAPAGQSRP